MRSDAEIEAEIALLKEMQPFIHNSGFGPNNVEQFKAQIEVLEQRLTEEKIEHKFYVDETAEEFSEGDNDVWADALAARLWMIGSEDLPPSHSENWGGMAHRNGWLPKPHTEGGKRV